MLHVLLLVSLEALNLVVGVHQLDFRLFGTMVWKLLITESFSQWKLNKLETENCIEIWGCSQCCWKAFLESDLIELISQFLELSVKDIDFWVDFVAENLNKLQKLGLEGRISWAFNVFTLEQMTQATLIRIKT